MKTVSLFLMTTLLGSSVALAARPVSPIKFNGVDEVCGERIAARVLKEATKRYGKISEETRSVREVSAISDLNKKFSMLKLHVVKVSDEVGPSEWLVVTDDEDCVIEFVGTANEE